MQEIRVLKYFVSVFFGVLAASSAMAQQYTGSTVTSAQVLPVNTFTAYAFAKLPNGDAIMGGWAVPSDVGPDKLFYVPNGSATPIPLTFTNPNYPPGVKPGYHINDPSIIAPSSQGLFPANRTGWLYMYFTCLPNQFADSLSDETEHNHICWAISLNGGHSWTDLGELIGQNNGLDNGGGWSPSATAVGPYIALFYHTSSVDVVTGKPITRIDRSVLLDADGWTVLSRNYMAQTNGTPMALANLNAHLIVNDGVVQWFVVANNFAAGTFAVEAWLSNDGTNFHPWSPAGPAFGPATAVTPKFQPDGTFTFSTPMPGAACGQPTWSACEKAMQWTLNIQ
jgi:hypothetical protein